MAATSRVVFSDQELALDEIHNQYQSLVSATREYHSPASPTYADRLGISTPNEVQEELALRLKEIDFATSMAVMSAIEAALRRDYLTRAYRKGREPISRALREVYDGKAERASLEEDILDTWKAAGLMPGSLVSEVKGANKYRHWLAHGRYWTPKLGRQYDYFVVFAIAERVFDVLLANP